MHPQPGDHLEQLVEKLNVAKRKRQERKATVSIDLTETVTDPVVTVDAEVPKVKAKRVRKEVR
jgi:hypothetical protein